MLGDVVREGLEEAHMEHHRYSVSEVDTPVVLGVESVEHGVREFRGSWGLVLEGGS